MRTLLRHAQRLSATPLHRRYITRFAAIGYSRITPSIRHASRPFAFRNYSTTPPNGEPPKPNKHYFENGNIPLDTESKRLAKWYIQEVLNKGRSSPDTFDEAGLIKSLEDNGIQPYIIEDMKNVEQHGNQHLSNFNLISYFTQLNIDLHPEWSETGQKRMEEFAGQEWDSFKENITNRVKSIKDIFGGAGDKQSPPDQQKSAQSSQSQQPQGQPRPNFSFNQEQQKQRPRSNQQEQGKSSWNQGQLLNWNTLFVTGLTAYLFSTMIMPGEMAKDITFQELRKNFLDKGLVEKIVVYNNRRGKVYLHRQAVAALYPDSPAANGNFFYYFTIGSVDTFERELNEAQNELNVAPSERIPVSYEDNVPWVSAIINVAPHLLFIAFLIWSVRRAGGGAGGGSGIFGMGKSRAKRFNHEADIKVKFADVAGMDEAKVEIMEFVSFLKEPWVYQKLGAKIPRGAILSGPPGTGKTLLAKATAGESGVPFFSVSGSEFVEMFVGVGPSRVRDLFATARKNTPCIIFIDEIDAIGRARSAKNYGGGNDERESTLNQILTEMDGFNTSDQVVVMAGTNRADILDKALLRPGRFDRHIVIDRPTMDGRKQIFAVHLKKILTHEEMDHLQGRLAALTPGFSGADIANCVNEAALIAARERSDSVTLTHFERAIERVIGGLERKSLVLSAEEKRTVAYHESGHAICGWFFKYADPLLKVSIIPRGSGALGYAQYLPSNGDTYLMNVKQMMDRMAMTLGGRVSEELHFETVTSGASDDFKKVTQMATMMVTRFGMSRKIGYLSFDDNGEQQFQKPFSEATARDIDDEVKRIVGEAEQQCRALLESKKKEIGLVAEELLKKEVLSRDDLVRLLGPIPFDDKGEFHKYFSGEGPPIGKDGLPPTDIPKEPSSDDGGMSQGGGTGPAPQPSMFEGRKDL